ncbi:MAG: porin family protein [Gemmatimonadaceae bacterium]
MRLYRSFLAAAAACVIMPSVSQAQFKRPSIGVLLGTNFATISDADRAIADVAGENFTKSYRAGLNAGVFVNIPFSEMFSLQPEIHFAQNGVKIKGGASTIDNIDISLGYVEVPLLLRLDLGHKSSTIRPLFVAGASMSYRVQCKLSANAGGATLTNNCNADNGSTDPFKKSDYSAIGGAGFALTTGGRSVSLQIRYTQGLQDILTTKADNATPKNSAIGILLGIGM